ncbi:hypothetical protein AB0L70_36350 [Kribbella sp. NPDC051952]|uniref:hypothetical protein n=1 Tax=Kribbella sp. NPDC051952 TaxID=3154851 RepID=UPI00343CAD45
MLTKLWLSSVFALSIASKVGLVTSRAINAAPSILRRLTHFPEAIAEQPGRHDQERQRKGRPGECQHHGQNRPRPKDRQTHLAFDPQPVDLSVNLRKAHLDTNLNLRLFSFDLADE